MSGLEDRCTQFHEAALGTGKSKGPAKEIATLRKFLHKNQAQRFTDKATSRLFDTIQIYCTAAPDKQQQSKTEDADESKKPPISISVEDREGLLEDALKMPFTVFTTKQKKTMLKWVEDIRGEQGASGGNATKAKTQTTKLTVIDLDIERKSLGLMQEDTGDTYEEVPLPPGDLGDQIQKAFETTEEALDVEATVNDNNEVTVLNLCT